MPKLAQWGIDMGDHAAVDTPQSDTYAQIRMDPAFYANQPSPSHVAIVADYTPPVTYVEFDPPIRSVEFYYSRTAGARAIWNGQIVQADSVRVRVMSRTPGTFIYRYYQTKVLRSNDLDGMPFDHWDYVKLQAGGDSIQWLELDGRMVIDNFKITRAKPDTTFQVSLSCSPSPVVRASTVSCTATWKPTTIPVGDISFKWHFQPDSVRVFPASNAQAYDPPPPIDTTAQGMSMWAGPGVLGGKVTVQGTWQGQVDTALAAFAVSPRSAAPFGDLPITFARDTGNIPTDLAKTITQQPDPDGSPKDTGVVGLNYDVVDNSGLLRSVLHGQTTPSRVAGGPNMGLWYVTAPGVQSNRGAKLRTWLTGRTPLLFSYSLSASLLTNRGLLAARRVPPKNKQAMHPDSLAFLTGVWAHETYGRNGAKGHEGQMEIAAKSLPTCGRVPAIIERVVAGDSVTLLVRGIDVTNEGAKSLYAAAGHDYVYGNYSNAPVYQVVSQTTNANNLAALNAQGDTRKNPSADVASDPRWSCSRVY